VKYITVNTLHPVFSHRWVFTIKLFDTKNI